MTSLKDLLEAAKSGARLSRPDRLRVLRYLEASENFNGVQIAELLQVSDRQLRRDRAEVRAQLRDEAERKDLFGELVAAHAWATAQVRRGLREVKPGSAAWWRGVRLGWEIEVEFWDRWRDRSLMARVERLEEMLGGGLN